MTDLQLDEKPQSVQIVAIALGANLGDPLRALRQAQEEIGNLPFTRIVEKSSFYRTAPVDSSGPDYVNSVLLLETSLPARELLHRLQALETKYGRVRPVGVHNAPRTLDLDILTYGNVISSDPELTLPHPRMHERAFVLVPLCEIAPDFTIPGKGPAARFVPAVADQRIEKI